MTLRSLGELESTPCGGSRMPESLRLRMMHRAQNYLADHAVGMFRPYDLPRQVLPILDHMEQTDPDIVIACDRGARLAGIALFAAWRQTRQSPFPTLDHKLHFARLSASDDGEAGQQRIDRIIQTSLDAVPPIDDRLLRIMFVDDWVARGGTQRYIQTLLEKHGVESTFATLCGGGSDVSVRPHFPVFIGSVLTMWRDNPEQIGVRVVQPDEAAESDTGIVPLATERSRMNRMLIHAGSRALASADTK